MHERAHRELLSAYTTAAVINHAFAPPEEPVAVTAFMPSHQDETVREEELSEEEQERRDNFHLEVLIAAEKMKRAAAERAKAGN